MKHLITILVVTAFAFATAQAGEDCCAAKTACSSKAKVMKTVSTVKGAQLLVLAKK